MWLPGKPFPSRIVDHIKQGGAIWAHNAQFERLIWWYVLAPDYGLPEPNYEQWRCTAAQARAHGLPGALGDCARALGIPQQKQADGRRLIQTYSVPGHIEIIPQADLDLFVAYCQQDVVVERMLTNLLRELSDYEWDEYALNERICDRGVPIDVPFAAAALDYAEAVRADVDSNIVKLTDGKVSNARGRKDRDAWFLPLLTEDQLDLIHEYKDGVKKLRFDQRHRAALLEADDLDPKAARFVELVEEAGGVTISKYTAMVSREVDGRLHGALMFNGAGQTGRFSSTGLQLHNLKREGVPDPDALIQLVVDGFEIDDVTATLAKLVRPTIYRPEGLTWCDYSSIEGRVAPWLANSPEGDAKLDLYRQGVDPYIYNAAATFGIPMEEVTKDQRQAGKIQELSLQFLGGAGALKHMARNYGMNIPDAQASMLRDKWRAANPWAMRFGQQLARAALNAVRAPGEWFAAGRVEYAFDGGDWLWCKLPSGRFIAYLKPRLEYVMTPWGEEVRTVTRVVGSRKPKTGEEWPRGPLNPTLYIENITQAVAADLLRAALMRCDRAGLAIVLHVHDEIVAEGYCEDELRELMLDSPIWAEGLPVDGEAGSGQRYGK